MTFVSTNYKIMKFVTDILKYKYCESEVSHFYECLRYDYVAYFLGFFSTFSLFLHDKLLLKCSIEYTNKNKVREYLDIQKKDF